MSIDRQYGLHEIPGTEAPVAQARREPGSAGFEAQMREYVNAIWAKLAALEGKIDDFKEWREELNYRLLSRVASPGPLSSVAPLARGEKPNGPNPATGEGGHPPPKPSLNKPDKPWLAEGVSKATWYRRHKGAA